jgi:PadR family transcriptional regulator PadR
MHCTAMYHALQCNVFFSRLNGRNFVINKELMAASSEPVVLAILAQGESYGYEMIQRVRELSQGEIAWTDGMLYPVLRRLEAQGQIESEWRTAENGRQRRYYRISQIGRTELKSKREQWLRVSSMLGQLWEPNPCPT